MKGIDVSAWNGKLDWNALKSEGVEFAILRCGVGSDIYEQDDVQFENNCRGCEEAGIPYGVYLYSYALDMNDLHSEIEHVERLISGKNITLGVWFDMEDSDDYKTNHGVCPYDNGELMTEFCRTFIDHFKSKGIKAGVYSNYDYFHNVLDYNSFSKDEIWLAHWGIDEPSMDCTMWQYTSDETFECSYARFDGNYYYGDVETVETENNNTESVIEKQDDSTIKVGDKVVVKLNINYDNDKPFYLYYDEYDVIEVIGDRVVIGIGDTVTSAISINNIEKA